MKALMRTCLVVIDKVRLERASQVAFAEKEAVIQALLGDGTHPTLSKGVGIGSLRRRKHDGDAFGPENGIEGRGEFGIAVMDEEAPGGRIILQLPGKLPGLLRDPDRGGLPRTASQIDLTSIQFDKEQDIDCLQEKCVYRKEIASQELRLVVLHEVSPAG